MQFESDHRWKKDDAPRHLPPERTSSEVTTVAPSDVSAIPIPSLPESENRGPAAVLPPVPPASAAPVAVNESESFRSFKQILLANSWIVSLVIHLIAFILLSVVTYTIQSGAHMEITLSQSESPEANFTIAPEASDQNGNDLDDQMKQLVAASDQAAEMDFESDMPEFNPEFSLDNQLGSDSMSADAASALTSDLQRKAGNGKNAQFFGIGATGRNFVFIVDSSGSMGGRRWKNATRELSESLTGLQPNQQFYVIFFDHQTHLMFQGRVKNFRKSRPLKMLSATEENVGRVNKWLKRIDLGRDTMPRHSFDYGLSLNPDAIFFLTDGEFNDGTYEYLMGIAAQSDNVPTIHTVAFGNRSSGRTLEEIAKKFNGKFQFVR